MTTNSQIITDALREHNVNPEGVNASAEQATHGLRVLNRMMEKWFEEEVDLGYYEQTTSSATIPIPAWAEDGVVAQLAIRLAPTYGAQVSPELYQSAKDSYNMICRKVFNETDAIQDMTITPLGEARHRLGRSILTDV